MDRLYKGIKQFQEQYKKEESFYKKLSHGQAPDVLFITCCDSRVDPNLITQSKPGELFIVKNVGNIVPLCDEHAKKWSIGAAIEFAVQVLNIPDIVICGHSDCGALKALYKDVKELSGSPNLKEWVVTATPAKDAVDCLCKDPSYAARLEMTAHQHIIAQLENIKTYPAVMDAIAAGKVRLHGWYYDIGAGEVYAYNTRIKSFEKIAHSDSDMADASLEEPCEDIQ